MTTLSTNWFSTDVCAFISVDNTRTFEDKTLNQIYVPEGEEAAKATKLVTELCRKNKILTINVLDEHPLGHISLAANYKNKKPFDMITLEEVKDWTDKKNGLTERAKFNVQDVKTILSKFGTQRVWPDHSIKWTDGPDLQEPLCESDFDIKITKGINPRTEGYSWFDATLLDYELQKRLKTTIFIWGVATDYCAWQTAADAADLGYKVYVITPAVRWVTQEGTAKMIEVLTSKGVEFLTIPQLKKLIKTA